MGTFSATGTSSDVYIAPGHSALLVISNTFVATVILERKISGAYVPVYQVAAGITLGLPIDGTFRLRCSDYTSGTVTYALTAVAGKQLSLTAPDGSTRLAVDADGVVTANGVVIGAVAPAAVAATTISGTAITGTVINQATEDALTAAAGGTQAGALALSAACGIHRVTTVGSANDSVALPPAVVGQSHIVINDAASNSMQVFGTTPDTVNGVVTATGVAQAAGKTALYVCPVAGKWLRLLSA